MNRIKNLLLGCLMVLLTCQFTFAKEIKYDSFAYAMQLATPEQFTIGEVIVPDELYHQIYRKDLGDIRVFNNDKQIVQHVVIQSSEEVEKLKKVQKLNFFPLYEDKVKSLQNMHSQIKIDQTGVIVNVNGRQVKGSAGKIKGYVVDLSKSKDKLESVQVDWKWIGDKKSGIAKFGIRASKDLKSWNRFIKKAVLLELKKEDALIKQDTITMSLPKGTKYLYFDWTDLNNKMALTKIVGKTYKLKHIDTTKWKDVHYSKAKADTVFYRSYGHYKADQIKVALPQENMILKAKVFGRVDKKAKWKQVYSGILYRITDDEGELTNEGINIRKNEYSFWKIEILDNQGMVNVEELKMSVGFQSDKLLFMASGEPPFKIAYGNVHVLPLETTIESFLSNYDSDEQKKMTAQVEVEKIIELAGPKALEPPLLPSNWHEWLVWLVYLVIVVVLGKMVWSIVKEMNKA